MSYINLKSHQKSYFLIQRREEITPWDHDAILDRKKDLLLNDKTDYEGKTTNIVSDYINLVEEFIDLARRHSIQKAEMDNILSKITQSKHHIGDRREYKHLINGRFDVNIFESPS
jgi:hypothetical protein